MKSYPVYELHKDANLHAHVDASYPVVFYHKNCIDGIAAAYIAWDSVAGRVLLHEFEYGMQLPNCGNRRYIFVDCCPSVEQLDWIEEHTAVPEVKIYDHHKEQVQTLQKHIAEHGKFMRECFDINVNYMDNLSGAGIIWRACNPHDFAPEWVVAVSEGDLWHKDHPGVAEFGAFASKLPLDIRGWSVVDDMLYETMIAIGGQYLRAEQKRIEALAATADYMVFGNNENGIFFKVGVVAAERDIRSVLADHIMQHEEYCTLSCVYQHNMHESKYVLSFRSLPDSVVSAKQAAEFFGGGGHEKAAGASTSDSYTLRASMELFADYVLDLLNAADTTVAENPDAPE